MNNNLKKFLYNRDLNDSIFIGKYGHKYKIHKEKFNERFDILYMKKYSDSLHQNDYDMAGYFDIFSLCIYEVDSYLEDMVEDIDTICTRTFDDLKEEMLEKVNDYIERYSFHHKEELEDITLKQHDDKEELYPRFYKEEVDQLFIQEDNPKIELEKIYDKYRMDSKVEITNKDIFIEYLNNPLITIKRIADEFIIKSKYRLGLKLLIYNAQNEYLDQIILNKDNEYLNLYVNKKILASIKNVDAKTLNITIEYGGKTLTFKYDYLYLINALEKAQTGTCDFSKAYEKVTEFINKNDVRSDGSSSTNDFLFTHVTSITYGKKELYCNNLPSKEVGLEEDIDLEI